jgi:4-azaleucine resistance transporter AzlC
VAAVGVFGVSYGVLASAAGLAVWQTVLMSVIVFAGSAQFAFVSVVAAGGAPWLAVLSAALLNARYLAIGTAAARTLPGARFRRFFEAQLIVDESFAIGVGAGSADEPDARAMLLSGAALWTVWVTGSLAGALLGPVLGDPKTLGLDAAFPALFVALVWPLISSRPAVRAAIAGAVAAAVLEVFLPTGAALAGAAVAGLVAYRP